MILQYNNFPLSSIANPTIIANYCNSNLKKHSNLHIHSDSKSWRKLKWHFNVCNYDKTHNKYNNTDPLRQRTIERNKFSLSAWLTAVPILKDSFNLTAVEFRDTLCLRYSKPLLQLPLHCDGCGSEFTITHALDCKKGGLVTQRHNEVRDLLYDLSALVWNQTIKEPIVWEADSAHETLIGDISARGV